MKKETWKKQLHIAMKEVRPADWYYKFIRNLLQQQKEEIFSENGANEMCQYWIKKTKEEIIKKIKEKSKKLPIEIEKTNSDYRQGMHAGLDLAIDDIIKLLKSA